MDLNKAQDIKEGITRSSHDEPDAVLIELVDDEEDSYIDLNLEETSESDEFEFQISFPSQSSPKIFYQSPADELFHDGQIVPLKNIYSTFDKESSQAPNTKASFSTACNSMDILTVELLRCRELSPDNQGAIGDNRRLVCEFKEKEPAQTRKNSKIMWVLNGGIMKFLITMKSYCSFHLAKGGSNYINRKNSPRHWKLVLPFYKWTPPWKSRGSQISSNVDNKTNNSHNQHATKLMISDINDAEKDAFDALNLNLGRGNPNFEGYPTSILQSPYHTSVGEQRVMAMDRSINAAIDHCKESLGSYDKQR